MKKLITALCAMAVAASGIWAQTLTVNYDENVDTTTKIVFKMAKEKTADIYQINGFSFGTSTGVTTAIGGGTAVSSGVSNGTSTSFLCATPAELTLDKGSIQLQVGQGMLAKSFRVDATGGTQTWEITPPSTGLFTGGFIATVLGGVAATVGLTFAVVGGMSHDPGDTSMGSNPVGTGVTVGLVGVAALVSGIIMLTKSYPKATLVSIIR